MVGLILSITFWIGFVRLMSTLASIVTFIINHFKQPLDLKSRYGENSWAVITGGANGIGGATAKKLAKQGFNIYIWDKDEKAIADIESSIKDINSEVKVTAVHKDLSKGDGISFYRELYEEVKDLDVSILINNVSIITFKMPHTNPGSLFSEMLKLNVILPAMLSSLFIKKLLAREKKSAIITMSSCVGAYPSPPENIFTATKAFSRFLGLGLAEEFRDKIDCQTVCHGLVKTDMIKGYTLDDAVTPEFAADYELNKLGIVEETSASATQEILVYGPVLSIYYCSLELFYYVDANLIWKRFAEEMKLGEDSYLP